MKQHYTILLFLKTAIFFVLTTAVKFPVNAQMYVDYSTALARTDDNTFNLFNHIELKNDFIHLFLSELNPALVSNNFSSIKTHGRYIRYDLQDSVLIDVNFTNGAPLRIFSIRVDENSFSYIVGQTDGTFPVTDNSISYGGIEVVYIKLNPDGTVNFATFLSSDLQDAVISVDIDNQGNVFIVGSVNGNSLNFETTDGSSVNNGANNNAYYVKFDQNNNKLFSTIFGAENLNTTPVKVKGHDGEAFIIGHTTGNNFPTTDNTNNSDTTNQRTFYTRFDAQNNMNFSTIIDHTGGENTPSDIHISNGVVYITGRTSSGNFPVTTGIPTNYGNYTPYYRKYDYSNNLLFSTTINSGNGNTSTLAITLLNNEVIILGTHNPGAIPFITSDGSTTIQSNSPVILKFDTQNNSLILSKLIQGFSVSNINSNNAIQIKNNCIYIFIQSNSLNLPNYNLNSISSNSPCIVKINAENKIDFVYRLPDINLGFMNKFVVSENSIHLLKSIQYWNNTTNYTPQNNQLHSVDGTFFNNNPFPSNTGFNWSVNYTRLNECVKKYDTTFDTIQPSILTACINGYVQPLRGKEIELPGDSLPILYKSGVPFVQSGLKIAKYQWQIADNETGPWSNIQGANNRNYSPSSLVNTKYYRRLALSGDCCGDTISISEIATVLVSEDFAPVLQTNGPDYICPNNSIQLGGSPTVQGGTPPYVFNWDFNAPSVSNPLVAPSQTTIYTLFATDNNNCTQVTQHPVYVFSANAGSDLSSCAGESVQLQAALIPPSLNPTYQWSPATGLSCTNCSNPIANPTSNTTYTLTVTFEQSDGTICSTSDNVTVTVVPAPNAGFAGEDQTICFPGTVQIGTPPQSGYDYTWNNNGYINDLNNLQNSYYTGNSHNNFSTRQNPMRFIARAEKDGCTFLDTVTISVIRANAGLSGCGPRTLGLYTDAHNLNETFEWTLVSGNNHLIGPTNVPYPTVGASTGGVNSVYRLTTTLNGVSCTSTVNVPYSCGGGTNFCNVEIDVNSLYGCPNVNFPNNEVFLSATHFFNSENYSYSWSPAWGLSNYNSPTVQLLTDQVVTYTVTITSNLDPSFTCSKSITVNQDPLPVFTAQDHYACSNTTVNLGMPPYGNYTYEWFPNDSFPNYEVSNPSYLVKESIDFYVKVEDAQTGCYIWDTARITLADPLANAGQDYFVCENAVVTLGIEEAPNTTYSWSPANVAWQNGTNENSAQPEVLVASSITFTLMATNELSGCSIEDEINITVDNNPFLPFLPDTTICLGDEITIGRPPLPGVSYSWLPIDVLDNPDVAQPVATPSETTTFTLAALFPNCVTEVYRQVTIHVSNPSFSMPDLTYCPTSGAVALGQHAPDNMSTYAWSPPNLVSNQDIKNPFTLNPPPSSATTFTLQVVDQYGCIASGSFNLQPITSLPIAGIDRSVCVGDSVTLGSIQNEQGAGISYSWSPANLLSCSDCLEPVFVGNTPGEFEFLLTKTIDSTNCSNTAKVEITVLGFDLPNLNSQTICQNSCVQIGIASTNNVQYSWSPVEGLSNPNISNPVACPDGTTTYRLTATNSDVCFVEKELMVYVDPTPAPTIVLEDIHVCESEPIIQLLPSISPSANYGYLWAANSLLSNNTVMNPIVSNQVGNHTFELTVTNIDNGCFGSSSLNVYIYPDSNIDSVQVNICASELPFVWNNIELQQAGWYSNSFNAGFGCDSLIFLNLVVFADNDTIYQTSYTCNLQEAEVSILDTINENGCPLYILSEVQYVESDSTFNISNSCNPADAGTFYQNLQNQLGCDSSHTSVVHFVISDSLFVEEYTCDEALADSFWDTVYINDCGFILLTEIVFKESDSTTSFFNTCNYPDSGVFVFNLQNQFGCDSSHISYINFRESDTVYLDDFVCDTIDIGIQETMYQNQFGCDSLVVIDYQFIGTYYTVTPNFAVVQGGETLNFNIENEDENLVFNFEGTNGENCLLYCNQFSLYPDDYSVYYYFTLTDSSTGCFINDTIRIDVKFYSELNIPNIFTPNNDGENDVYKVYGKDLMEFSLMIFDRWGGKVFETTDINEGWNGTFKGKPVNSGIYVGTIKATGKDALKYEKTINIKLIR